MQAIPIPLPPQEQQSLNKGHDLLEWPLEPELEGVDDLPLVAYRDLFARKLADRPLLDILSTQLSTPLEDLNRMVESAERLAAPGKFSGAGIELGAGCGALSSLLAQRKGVECMLAVELCRDYAERIIPKVARHVCGEVDSRKVVNIRGSFNNLALPDECLDFAVEIGSLHHSDDLDRSFKEVSRILKPGGFLICWERCQPDDMTDNRVQELLDIRYGPNFLRSHGYPPNIVLTRRENGEHEYRMREWRESIEEAGLQLVHIHRFLDLNWRRAIRGLLSILPRRMRQKLYKTEDAGPGFFFLWLALASPLASVVNKRMKILHAPRDRTMLTIVKPERA